ncbi:carbohydrate-binding module family 13 protein [Plicaturopsis crispa FD-325 SS-3]|uniref:Carbohydrate-binding module family 13 protein n=1 Tax=Plicaturopsis crispa FD-325 SS-3 TaxID=944288 RepID=A0A0C9T6E0_PLICR|nr:carbohydrate-binding module family 13 protein [Plicaturopsis crispa FD-325 SS-3]
MGDAQSTMSRDSDTTVRENETTAKTDKTFEPGVYRIVNFRSGTALDLSAGDKKTIMGFPSHGGENQQWEFQTLGAGFSIRNVAYGLYISGAEGIREGIALVASPFPVSWVVEVDEGDRGTAMICWPESRLVFDLHEGRAEPGTKIHLYQRHEFYPIQMWRILKCRNDNGRNAYDKPSEALTADTVVDAAGLDGQGLTITTTTTTTTVTKVVRVTA